MVTKKSARNKMYWIDKGLSEQEAITMARSRMPGTLEYYTIFKGMSDVEAREAVNTFQSNRANTIENFIRKYGEIEGTVKWNEYTRKQAYSNTYEYKKKKYGWTTDQYNDYNKNRACTESNFTRRWGDEIGKQKWKEYCRVQSYTNSIEYFIEKYGKEEGEVRFARANFLKSHTLESYIERFDNVEAASRAMTEYLKSVSSKTPYSRIADDFFKRLTDRVLNQFEDVVVFSHVTGKEWFIRNEDHSFFFVDFYIPKLKYAIEFNGDYWHANPSIYGSEDTIHYPGLSIKASEIWNKDSKKEDAILKSGVISQLEIVWESDFRNLDETIIDKHFDKIKELYENQTNK